MNADNRKWKRFRAKNVAFAAFIRPNEPIVVGKVVDISTGGLGVRYLATGAYGEGPSRVEIFGPDSAKIARIKSTIVYDKELPEESLKILSVRRCGVKFEQPASSKSSQFQEFINTHFTVGEA